MSHPPLAYFAVTEARGSGWDPERARRQQDQWDAHAAFMDALVDDGVVILGGPLGSGEIVLLIIAAANEEDVVARLADDPWFHLDILRIAKIERWEILLDGRR
jgi:uncharacterized protein YciI